MHQRTDALCRLPCSVGGVLARQQRFAEAEAAYRQALRIDPASTIAHSYLADFLMGRNRLPEAETVLREAARILPQAWWTQHNLGRLFETQKRFAEAESAYREATRLNPSKAASRPSRKRATARAAH